MSSQFVFFFVTLGEAMWLEMLRHVVNNVMFVLDDYTAIRPHTEMEYSENDTMLGKTLDFLIWSYGKNLLKTQFFQK